MEVWKDIVGFEGHYQVSSEGRFRSIAREVTMACGHGKLRYQTIRGGNCVTPYAKGCYLYVSLRVRGNNVKCLGAHAVVCRMFHGDKPTAKHVCNHKNGNKHDNRSDNLEWATARENVLHARHVLGTHPFGSRNGNSKLTESRVKELRKARSAGATYDSLAIACGVSKQTIFAAVNGKTWKHVS